MVAIISSGQSARAETNRFERTGSGVQILLSEEELREGVARMAREINQSYGKSPLTIVGVLTGSVVLLADLIRQLEMPIRLAFILASSYRGATTTRGDLVVNDELVPDVADRNVLVVDDIFDTGQTLQEVMARMRALGPRSVRSLVLLRKEGRQQVSFEPDFAGFNIPNEFVVGYGLDYHDAYRNLPYVAILESAELKSR
jgi:hypoxanthine phosphoribosyltransferase